MISHKTPAVLDARSSHRTGSQRQLSFARRKPELGDLGGLPNTTAWKPGLKPSAASPKSCRPLHNSFCFPGSSQDPGGSWCNSGVTGGPQWPWPLAVREKAQPCSLGCPGPASVAPGSDVCSPLMCLKESSRDPWRDSSAKQGLQMCRYTVSRDSWTAESQEEPGIQGEAKHSARLAFCTHDGCPPTIWSPGWKPLSLIPLWSSVRGATVPEINKTQHEGSSRPLSGKLWVTLLFCCCYSKSPVSSAIDVILLGYKVNVSLT